MEIAKINVPVKCLGPKCLSCPNFEINSADVNYGKETTLKMFSCKNLQQCLFLSKFIEEQSSAIIKR